MSHFEDKAMMVFSQFTVFSSICESFAMENENLSSLIFVCRGTGRLAYEARRWRSVNRANVKNLTMAELRAIGDAFKVNLWNADVEDFSHLSSVHRLILGPNVRDAQFLGFQDYLSVTRSPLTDVANLRKVKYLDLSYCVLLADVSALSRVHVLILNGCNLISRIDHLVDVICLDVTNCPLITSVNVSNRLECLDVEGTSVSNFNAINRLPRLRLPDGSITYCETKELCRCAWCFEFREMFFGFT